MSYFDELIRKVAVANDLDPSIVDFGVLAKVWRSPVSKLNFDQVNTVDISESGWIDISDRMRSTNLAVYEGDLAVYEGDSVQFYHGLINQVTDAPISGWWRDWGKSWYEDHEISIRLTGIDQGSSKDTAEWSLYYGADLMDFENASMKLNSVNGFDTFTLLTQLDSIYSADSWNNRLRSEFRLSSDYADLNSQTEGLADPDEQLRIQTVDITPFWSNPYFNFIGEYTIPALEFGDNEGIDGPVKVGDTSYEEFTIGSGEFDGEISRGVSAQFNYIDLPDYTYRRWPENIAFEPQPVFEQTVNDYVVVPTYRSLDGGSFSINVIGASAGYEDVEVFAGYLGAPDLAAAIYGDLEVRGNRLVYTPRAEFDTFRFDYLNYYIVEPDGDVQFKSLEITSYEGFFFGYGTETGGLEESWTHPDFGSVGFVETMLDETYTGSSGGDWIDGGWGKDTLRGEAGQDFIVGGAGADLLEGGAGDDTLFSGTTLDDVRADGDDTVSGGMGIDIAYFLDRRDDVTIAREGAALRITSSEGSDLVLSDVEQVAFEAGNFDTLVTYGFAELWGENIAPAPRATETVRVYGTEGGGRLIGSSIGDIIHGDGLRAQYFDTEANAVFRLYHATLGRAPDAAGHAQWTTQIAMDETSLDQIAQGFVGSREFQSQYGGLDASAFVTLLYQNVLGRDPDAAGLASWTSNLAGGASRESVVLGFSQSREFIQSTTADARSFAAGADPASWSDDVFRLYQATLDRAPDIGGFTAWLDRLADGTPLEVVIGGFVNSAEFSQTYGGLTDEAFVTLLYNNVLGREPDAGGLTSWLQVLAEGAGRASVVMGFSQSQEFVIASQMGLRDWIMSLGVHDEIVTAGGVDMAFGGILSDAFLFAPEVNGHTTIGDFEPWDILDFSGFGYASDGEARGQFEVTTEGLRFSDFGVIVDLRPAAGTVLSNIEDLNLQLGLDDVFV